MKNVLLLAFLSLLVATTANAYYYGGREVVYGEDDRKDIVEVTNPMYLQLAKATAAMIPKSKLQYNHTYQNFKINSGTLADRGVCSYARFVEQKTAAMCSGFLVAPDLLVTAGHCVDSVSDCKNNYWVFGFEVSANYPMSMNTALQENVYSCAEIIEQKLERTGLDYALIKLDRPVVHRRYLRVRTEGKVNVGDPLVVIGHPTGLPTKVADDAYVRTNDKLDYFATNLDTFGGNSGSAVFNAETGVVEGILVRGETDYTRSPEGCIIPNKCTMEGCRGEDVTRITKVDALMGILKRYFSRFY